MGDGEKVTVQSALNSVADRLRVRSDTPELDAHVLLANILRKPRSWLAAHPEARLDPEPVLSDIVPDGEVEGPAAALEASVQRLERGEPLPYVLGGWEFFGLLFDVTPNVLIPRPETELLVERALSWLRKQHGKVNVLDVGTGSGCIAISLAFNLPEIQVVATDISSAALDVARRNAGKHHVADRITFLEADLLPSPLLPFSFSLILANLPYIPTATLHGLPIFGREPSLALDGGADGLDIVRRLLAQAPARLAPGGMILLEIEASQGSAAEALALEVFPQAAVKIHQDLVGHDRLIEIQN
jgi:release factor glutamine methyltransferase